jgi:uncharacterized protein (TIGR03067 family)
MTAMKTLGMLVTGLALVVVAGLSAQDKADKNAKDFDASKLEGTWKITEGTKFGEKIPADSETLKGEIVITKDAISIKEGGQEMHKMTYKLDTKASPIAITMTGVVGPAKDMTSEGIIELKGDELKLCYSMPGEARPTKFESGKDSKVLCFVMKRGK